MLHVAFCDAATSPHWEGGAAGGPERPTRAVYGASTGRGTALDTGHRTPTREGGAAHTVGSQRHAMDAPAHRTR